MTTLCHHLRIAAILLGLSTTCIKLAELFGVTMLNLELNPWIFSHNR